MYNRQTVNVLPVLPKPQNGSGIRAGTPLSSAEDKEMKKKLRNRESALAARERKKQKMLELEKKVTELGRENNALKVENCTLRGTLSTVMRKYGAPQKEIEDTLKSTQPVSIKKEPTDSKPKSQLVRKPCQNRNLIQKVISLGPNERKPRTDVQVKQEVIEITSDSKPQEIEDVNMTPTENMTPRSPKVAKIVQAIQNPGTGPKFLMTSNLVFKGNTLTSQLNNNYQMNQENNQEVNPLDMVELPVVKQEPQEYNCKLDMNESVRSLGSPIGISSPSSSDSLIVPNSPLWSASGSPASDSAYSTGSENGHSNSGIQLSPLRSQTSEALSCTIRVPQMTNQNHCRTALKRSYPKDDETIWYESPEPHPNMEQNTFRDNNYSQGNCLPDTRVPNIHHVQNDHQWASVLQNDIHMTSTINSNCHRQNDPNEFLNSSQQYQPIGNHHQNHHQNQHQHIDFPPSHPIRSNNEFDCDRPLFQTSMLNIDEVLFGLS